MACTLTVTQDPDQWSIGSFWPAMSVALHGSISGKTHQIAAMLSLASCIPFSQQCLVHPLSLNVLGSSSGYRSIAVDVVHSAGPGKRAAKANTSIKRGMPAMHCMPLNDMYLKVQTLAHAALPYTR